MVTVIVVFSSGAVIEIPADKTKAGILLGDFTNDWDAKGVKLLGDLMDGRGGSLYRIKPSDISGIFVKP